MTIESSLTTLLELGDQRDAIFQAFLDELKALGWPVTDWQKGNPLLTLLQVISRSHADVARVIQDITRGGLLELSEKDWLTYLARNVYSVNRKSSQFAVVHVKLTCSASAGPYSITANSSKIITNTGKRYTSTNTTTQTLSTGSTLILDYKAESPGINYNLSLGAVISLVTALPGVTLAVEEVGTSDSPMVIAGTNEESDAQLVLRCQQRLAALGIIKTDDAWSYLATSIPDLDPDLTAAFPGVATITKVLVDSTNPDGPGTFRIYLAGAAGGITDAPTIAAVDSFLQPRVGLCASLTTLGAINDTITVEADVQCKSANVANTLATIEDLLADYQAQLPIGNGTDNGIVYRAQILENLMTPDGVINVPITTLLLNAVASDYTPVKGHIAVLDYSGNINMIPV